MCISHHIHNEHVSMICLHVSFSPSFCDADARLLGFKNKTDTLSQLKVSRLINLLVISWCDIQRNVMLVGFGVHQILAGVLIFLPIVSRFNTDLMKKMIFVPHHLQSLAVHLLLLLFSSFQVHSSCLLIKTPVTESSSCCECIICGFPPHQRAAETLKC